MNLLVEALIKRFETTLPLYLISEGDTFIVLTTFEFFTVFQAKSPRDFFIACVRFNMGKAVQCGSGIIQRIDPSRFSYPTLALFI